VRSPLILFYNTCFGGYPDFTHFRCQVPCTFTTDRKRLPSADAVVFHLPGNREFMSARKYPHQLWVAWSMESRVNTPGALDARFMRAFDLTISVSRQADVWCPYLPTQSEWLCALGEELPGTRDEEAACLLMQSAQHNASQRNEFAAELMRHIKVHSYGKFLTNRTIDGPDEGPATKLKLIRRYKFCLALENTIEPDYVTEKFFQPLLAGSIPIYRGAPDVDDYAPGDHCYVDAQRFENPKALADYLNHLAHTPEEYAAYFAWRQKPLRPAFVKMLEAASTEVFCRLADVVHARLAGQATPHGRPFRPFGIRGVLQSNLSYARSILRS
jgi:hypothetical protein